jgi:competence protein ComEC
LERIDRLIVSHGDKDHAGGLVGLVDKLPIGEVLSGEPGELQGVNARLCRSGTEWQWDGVRFRILHPDSPLPAPGNNRSCVLQVENGSGSVLLTGDAEWDVERRLAAELGGSLRSSVLVAGHHGSDTSTSEVFLQEVVPDYVFFSAGYRNRYQFPRQQVRERVAVSGAIALDTIGGGAIEMLFPREGRPTPPRSYREEQGRYWTHVP